MDACVAMFMGSAEEQTNFEEVGLLWRPRSCAQWTPAREERGVPFI